jgi:RHS repeat-associated protein
MSRRSIVLIGLLLCTTAVGAQPVVKYYHVDGLGSVRTVTDATGQVIERHEYLPFGEEWNAPASSQPLHFTGKERDAETGLDYFGARYYAAKIGRFTTIDPVYTWRDNLADPQRWNRYAYVRNNPLRYVDPDGRVLDTVVDVVFIAYDLFDIGRSVYRGEGVSGAQLAALGGDVAGALLPFATGVGAGIRAANKAENVIDIATAANKTETAASSGRRLPDFVVAPDGTAIPVSQSRMRAGFDEAGFPSRTADQTAEAGVIHEVPTRYGPVDVRTMEGSAHHPRRAVTSRPGTSDPVKLTGERFTRNESRAERRAASHLEQKP